MVSDFFATEITEITEKKDCYDGVRRARERCQLWLCVVSFHEGLFRLPCFPRIHPRKNNRSLVKSGANMITKIKKLYWGMQPSLGRLSLFSRLIVFFVKTVLYRYTPRGFGYYRLLRSKIDPSFRFDRDKHPVRQKHHGKGGWKDEKTGAFHYRDYSDYQEYLDHQKSKWDEVLSVGGGHSSQAIAEYRFKFLRRFRHLPSLLPQTARIVCLGARQGTEVEVLHDLGFTQAYGLDLNPGPNNPWVRPGDFMHLKEETNSIDMVYSNAVDHAFELEGFFCEHARVLKPDGYVLYDVSSKEDSGGAFEAVEWGGDLALLTLMMRHFKTIVRVELDDSWKWFLLHGKRIEDSPVPDPLPPT